MESFIELWESSKTVFFLIILFGVILLYNLPIFMFFWLYYDDERMLSVEKAIKIKHQCIRCLVYDIVFYLPYLYFYEILRIATRLPKLWPSLIPVIFAVINMYLIKGLLAKARERVVEEKN